MRMPMPTLFRQKHLPTFGVSALVASLLLVMVAGLPACGGCEDDGNGLVSGDALAIDVTPGALNFGAVAVGKVVEQTVTLKHIGDSGTLMLAVELVADGSDFALVAPTDLDLTAGESLTLTVQYAPSDAVTDSGTLVITTNIAAQGGGTRTIEVPLLTLAQDASLVADPGTLAFDGVASGLSVTKSVTLRNLGQFDLTVTALGPNAASSLDFVVASTPTLPQLVPVDGEMVVEVTYTPTGFSSDEGTLEVAFDALSGAGLTAIPLSGLELTARLSVTPEPVNFELQFVDAPVTLPIALGNVGSFPLQIDSIEVVGDGPYAHMVALEQAQSPQTIEVGGAPLEVPVVLTVAATLAPTDQPLAYVRVISNDPAGEPTGQRDIPVFGQRRGFGLEVFPPDIVYFGYVNAGGRVTHEVVLYNAANTELSIESVFVEGGFELVDAESWSFTAAGGLTPYVMAPGESITVSVAFTNAPGDWPPGMTAWGQFNIASNDPQKPTWEVLLNARAGTAEPCALQMVPDALNIGFVATETAADAQFDLVNVGQNTCTWVGAAIDDCENSASCELPTPETPPSVTSSARWSVIGGPDVGTAIEPGDVVPLKLRFQAPAVESNSVQTFDARLTAWTTFVDDNTGATATTTLHGEAWGPGSNLTAHVAKGQLLVQPAVMDLGTTPVGCRSETHIATAENIGAAPLMLTNFELSGCGLEYRLETFPPLTEPLADGGFGRTLLPGEVVEFGVSYAPQDDSEDTCKLLVQHAAGTAPEEVNLVALGTYEADHTDIFYDSPSQKVDVLFVVDDSGSMSGEQANLADSFQAFIQEAAKWQSDYQIGVTTTTVGFPNGGDLRGSPTFVNGSNWEKFVNNVLVGVTGSGDEKGLWAAKIGLSSPLTDVTETACASDADCSNPFHVCMEGTCGGRNRHFIREGAALELIFVSDEDDQSPESLSAYLNFFSSIKGIHHPELLHIHSIVGPYGGCSSDDGAAVAGHRYLAMAEDTGGIHFSICQLDFAKGLEDIGEIAFASTMKYVLTHYPAPTTISVTINGVPCPLTAGGIFNWNYDSLANTVTLADGGLCRAAPGDEVKIHYELLCYATP